MLAENYSDKRGKIVLTEENVKDFILFYIHVEGQEDFQKLKAEVAEIVQQKDLKKFKNKNFTKEEELNFVAGIILKHH